MTKARKLLELFGGTEKIKPTRITDRGVIYNKQANIDGHKLLIGMAYTPPIQELDISFTVDHQMNIRNIGYDFALKVFSVVAKVLRGVVDDIKLENLKEIRFHGDLSEPSRLKAYDRVGKWMAKEFNGRFSYEDKSGYRLYKINLG